MTTGTTVADINREVVALWRERFNPEDPPIRWPMICPKVVENGLTVIGCNPALPKSNYYAVPIFEPNAVTDPKLEELAAFEIKARISYPYYAPFSRLADDLKLPFEHVDLFFFRETKQANVQKLVMKRGGTLNNFGQRQVDLAARLLALSRPQIILVANAFAARVFKKQLGLRELDEEGLYWATVEGRSVPVFLSGMLSGQRCLDNHSHERLVWHMRRALAATKQGNG